jgi:hypothetical protein
MPEAQKAPPPPTKKSMEKEVHISKKEEQDRLDDLEKALKIYGGIRSKAAKILPMLEDVAKEIAQFQQHCSQVDALRTLRLTKKLVSEPMMKVVLGSRHQITQLIRVSERAEQSIEGIETEIIDPTLLR